MHAPGERGMASIMVQICYKLIFLSPVKFITDKQDTMTDPHTLLFESPEPSHKRSRDWSVDPVGEPSPKKPLFTTSQECWLNISLTPSFDPLFDPVGSWSDDDLLDWPLGEYDDQNLDWFYDDLLGWLDDAPLGWREFDTE